MGFWLTVMFLVLIYLVIMLVLKVIKDKSIQKAREEMPGKVAVLTGASTILGEALAQTFYRAGCKVVLVGPNEPELERVRAHLFSLRPKDVPVYQPEVVAMDLNDTTLVKENVASILEQCGQVDILINNSTICTRSDVLSATLDTDIRVMNVNYFGPIALTKALLPSMIDRNGGKLVFVSSVAGKVPIPFRSTFAASKHALQAFCDSLRAEIAMYNLTVLVSSPEYISMDLSQDEILAAGTEQEIKEKGIIPLGDSPQKIADAILLSVLRNDKENVKASFKFAYWLRVTFPAFFHFMMSRRAEQSVNSAAPTTNSQRF